MQINKRFFWSLFGSSVFALLMVGCDGGDATSDSKSESESIGDFDDEDDKDFDEEEDDAEGAPGAGKPDASSNDGAGQGPKIPEPEQESEGQGSLVSPVVSGNYVFHRSAVSAKVSAMHSETLKIISANVGYRGIAMVAVPNAPAGGAKVAVLGRSQVEAEVAIVTIDARGTSQVKVYPVARGVNDVVADPTGRFVFAYHNVTAKLPSTAGSDQELTVVDLQADKAVKVSVGVHPREIVFSQDNQRAFVTTADGVSVLTMLALGEGGKQPLIPVVPRIGLDPKGVEIKIDAASGQAVARALDLDKLWVTDLGSGAQVEFALAGPATDLDVAGGRAYAVVPGEENSSLVELALPVQAGAVPKTVAIQGAYVGVGEYSEDGQTALLYTTRNPGAGDDADAVDASKRRLTILKRGGGDWASQERLFVEVPVREVGISPDNANAILLHSDAGELNEQAPYAYTLIDLKAQFPIKKLQHVVSPLTALMFTPSGDRAALVSRAASGGASSIEIVSLRSFVVESQRLASPAEQLGFVPKPKLIFVSQQHPLGRVSLFDEAGEVQTVTGFELDGGVKVGDN